jgi:outer membrane protein assembly factor BamB
MFYNRFFLILVTVTTIIAIIHGVNVYPNNVFSQTVQPQPQPQQNQVMSSNYNAEASGGAGESNNNTQMGEKNKAEQAQVPPSQQVSEEKKYNAQVTKVLNQMNAPLNKTLPTSKTTSLGTEPINKNNWITANHDIYNTRSSNQTIIGKDNVDKLQVKWIFNDQSGIEQPPLVIGNTVYVQDNKATVFAFDAKSGLNQWKTSAGNGSGAMHGLTFDQGIIFASSGSDAKVIAINATDGKILWKSAQLGPSSIGYSIIAAPIVWKDYIVVGSAGGDSPPNTGAV